jgi:hypothetical protein
VPGLLPTPAFASVALDIKTVPAGAEFGRIYRKTFPDPLGFGKNPSRFSDPRRRVADNRFGVLYLGSSLKVCFLETVLRDERDGIVGQLEIAESELDDRRYAEIRVRERLQLLDLTSDGPVRMGIPSDVARSRGQALARKWSVAFHDHPRSLDGIIYPSRLNGESNLAIFDRAVRKLELARERDLKHAARLPDVLNDFFVALL